MAIEKHKNWRGKVKTLAVDGVWLRPLGKSVFEARGEQIAHVALSELPEEVEIAVKDAGPVVMIEPIDGTEAMAHCMHCVRDNCIPSMPLSSSKRFHAAATLVMNALPVNADIDFYDIYEIERQNALVICLSVKGSTCGDVIRRVEEFFAPIQKRMQDLEAAVDAFIDTSLTV